MEGARKFWNKNAIRYAKSPVRDEAAYQKKLALTQKYFQPDWTVLEFGCGTGSTAVAHAPYVKHIIATDISDKMLDIGKQRARDAGVENISFQQGTLESIEFKPESFDAVLGLNVMHLLEDVDATISRVYNLLKPEGIFVSSNLLVNELNFSLRLLIRPAYALGLAPYMNRVGRQELLAMLNEAGFGIDLEWLPGKDSAFIIARKLPL